MEPDGLSAPELIAIAGGSSDGDVAATAALVEKTGFWVTAPEHFRVHALATQRAADQLAIETGYRDRSNLTVTSLLHDVGKLALVRSHPHYPQEADDAMRTPEERIDIERRELGIDHALVGGEVTRRWGLSATIADAIEHHHQPEADGEAAFVRLADMLAHYSHASRISPSSMLRSARAVGLGPVELRKVLLKTVPATSDPVVATCPLSDREIDVLRHAADGKCKEQIVDALGLPTETVDTRLHNIRGKLGAHDDSQAVHLARESGWL